MSRRFVHDIDNVFKNFKPRARIQMTNATNWVKPKPSFNGLTLSKEI